MESKAFNVIISLPFNLRCKYSIFRPLYHSSARPKLKCFPSSSWSSWKPSSYFSPLCTLSERGTVNALPKGAGNAVKEAGNDRILQVVLVSPQIPGNTGCIARTCAASAVGLHLVGEKRLLAFSKRGAKVHSEVTYRKGDWLVFGSETSGLPPEALLDCKTEPYGGGAIRIPMVETYVRCLNLSVSVGIALYEAARQLNYEQLQTPSKPYNGTESTEPSFLTEDIFA
ncbi:OLC1v1001574C1 [Oldenlandia corymbosa var. corymbosa]|uniref:OLC1v1001574C1 n=1 Tax=Oldenlandia corymbosa var. corymbosa TaxID=529605 RepID=A0AAV1D6A5_OLDCO|nr:OLC1v1001574C1 [Oldenlandia corymbosa var. corymbosa]